MELMEAVKTRHSVRAYTDRPIEADKTAALNREIDACNRESGLHIQLVTEEPEAFRGFMAHYGSFRNVRSYIALIGKKAPQLDEKIGYYGERIVLAAQQLGLNTCWVALTYRRKKTKCVIGEGEKLVCVIALGYGETQGVPHKSKPMEALCRTEGTAPDWFVSGMQSAMLAPTAMNRQGFCFYTDIGRVKAEISGGAYSGIDLGIVKYHFEIGAGAENFQWTT